MLGAIIGDIIGSRFEFKNHFSTDFELFTDECEFTDDTVCTIAVADAILNGKNYKDALLEWCRQYPNPKGAYGGSFNRWIHSSDHQPYNSFGNGSAMRVSPCGWLFNNRNDVRDYAFDSAHVTHNHPDGLKGAVCVADLIWHARNYYKKHEMKRLVEYEYGYSLNITCAEIRQTNTFNETCQVTVPQAIVCFLESNSFEEAIRLAVSIGGDSDTIAAIAGSIAEPFYGIPNGILSTALSYLPNDMLGVIKQFNNKLSNENRLFNVRVLQRERHVSK